MLDKIETHPIAQCCECRTETRFPLCSDCGKSLKYNNLTVTGNMLDKAFYALCKAAALGSTEKEGLRAALQVAMDTLKI